MLTIGHYLMRLRWWPIIALAVGSVPILAGYHCGTSVHQPVTAVLLAVMFLGCVRRDQLGRAILLTVIVIGSHSAMAIVLSARDPAGAAAILPGSSGYWERTRHWIITGEDVEYQWRHWLAAHGLILLFVALGSYLSFGSVAFAKGIEEVDLMNFYVGRLVAMSEDSWTAIALGWHPWSILRGVACTVIVFEVASLSLARLSNRPLSTRRRRIRRWQIGIGFACLDAIVKLSLAPTIRELLLANLRQGPS